MTTVERFINRHALARYAFVLISWPFEAIKGRVAGVWNPVGVHELRASLDWARWGGVPGDCPERPESAPMYLKKWSDPPDPVANWPWGQKSSRYMVDPTGNLAGPLSDPEGWVAAHRSNIDRRSI